MILSKWFYPTAIRFKVALFLSRNNFQTTKLKDIKIKKNKSKLFGDFEFYIVQLTVAHDKRVSIYSGVDSNLSFATEKALSEFCEGYYKLQHDDSIESNRSGIATHISYQLACSKAYYELIERDSFIMHFLVPSLVTKLIEEIETQAFHASTVQLQTCDKAISVFCTFLYSKIEKNYYIGLSAGPSGTSNDQLVLHSKMEAHMLLTSWLPNKFKFQVENNLKTTRTLLDNHYRAGGTPLNLNAIRDILYKNKKTIGFSLEKSKFQITHQYSSIGRETVFGSHPDILRLRFGDKWLNNKQEYINILNSRGLSLEHWNVHPLL